MVEEQFVKYSSPNEDMDWVKGEIVSLLGMIQLTNVRIRESIAAAGIEPENSGIGGFMQYKGQLIEQLMELLNEFDLGIHSVQMGKAA